MMPFDLPILAPSILAADYTKLGEQINTCVKAGIEWIHCDVMDGHFVPNISYGPVIVKAARQAAKESFLDVHLMIENPEKYIKIFAESGANLITVHQEACPHLHRTIQQIKDLNIGAGVAINPGTPVHHLQSIIEYVDMVLIMSVNPGFGGQQFIASTYQKIKDLAAMRSEMNADFLIEVDGGVGADNIQKISNAGADVFVAGSAIFKTENIRERIKDLTQKARQGKASFI